MDERDWSFVDKIYCISVRDREDRRAALAPRLEAAGLAERVEYVLVDKHPTDPERGIFESHRICARRGLAAGAGRILVLEDDVLFEDPTPARLGRVARFLDDAPGFDVFFLGALVNWTRRTRHPGIWKIRHACLTHAYVIGPRFAERLAALEWSGKPIDKLIDRMRPAAYTIYPALAYQSDAGSDNRSADLDGVRRWFGGLAHVQRANGWLFRYKWPILAGHLAFAAAVAAVVALAW